MIPVSPGRNSISVSASCRKVVSRSRTSRIACSPVGAGRDERILRLAAGSLGEVPFGEGDEALDLDLGGPRLPVPGQERADLLLERQAPPRRPDADDPLHLRPPRVEVEVERRGLVLPDPGVVEFAEELP